MADNVGRSPTYGLRRHNRYRHLVFCGKARVEETDAIALTFDLAASDGLL